MSKSMSVTFDDGTSHTYDNVPDYVTQEQVNARARDDFSDRKIVDTAEGAHPDAPPLPTAEEQKAAQPSVGEQALGMAQIPFQAVAEHPAVAAGAAAAWKAGSLGNKYLQAQQMIADAEKLRAQTAANHQAMQYAKMAARGQPVTPGMATPTPNMGAPATPPTPPTTPPAPPPVGGQAAAEGSNFLENMANKFGSLAQRVAPVLNNPVVRGVAKIGGVGGQMATYSPGLNTGEAAELERRRKVPFQPYSR